LLESTVSEYKAAVENASAGEIVDMDELTQRLTAEHDWTVEGAQAIASLAADYGAFILRNALALAIALGKEDGDLGL
jgi:hypothetical protein